MVLSRLNKWTAIDMKELTGTLHEIYKIHTWYLSKARRRMRADMNLSFTMRTINPHQTIFSPLIIIQAFPTDMSHSEAHGVTTEMRRLLLLLWRRTSCLDGGDLADGSQTVLLATP